MPRRIPSNVIGDIKQDPITNIIVPPVVHEAKPPVVRGIRPPVVDVPGVSIDYPTIDVPTRETFQGEMQPAQPPTTTSPAPDTRDLPDTPPVPVVPQQTIEVGGIDVPVPDPVPLVAAGSLAVVTTMVTLGSTIALNQLKNIIGPHLSRLLKKKKKIKIKNIKPVLHYIPNEDGTVECIQYSAKGMKVLEDNIEKFEQHLRDQVDIDGLWEYDNKIIIDEELSKLLTKEGKRRFKKYFVSPKVVAKKLGSKFAL